MPKFVIEREMPGAGKLSAADLKAASQKSCVVLEAMGRKSVVTLEAMGPRIQWLHSYVTDDKLYCVYLAPDEASIREHGKLGGFPTDRIARVLTMIDPATAE